MKAQTFQLYLFAYTCINIKQTALCPELQSPMLRTEFLIPKYHEQYSLVPQAKLLVPLNKLPNAPKHNSSVTRTKLLTVPKQTPHQGEIADLNIYCYKTYNTVLFHIFILLFMKLNENENNTLFIRY